MWTPKHRRAAERHGLRYPSDLTDAEWALIEPLIPPARHGGRKRSINVREVLNGIFYVLWTGCQWKALPKDLPPKSTVHDYLELWNWDGTLERIHHTLYVAVREQAGREASPTTAPVWRCCAMPPIPCGYRRAAITACCASPVPLPTSTAATRSAGCTWLKRCPIARLPTKCAGRR